MYRFSLRVLKSCIATSSILIILPICANAQDDNSVLELKPIVIDAAKIQSKLQEPTVLTDRVTQADIQNKQVDDVHDISRLDPVIGYNSRNDSFNIRGLDANRILTSIDGIKIPWLNDAARGVVGGASTFDFNSLSTLDIIKGSDSSLYGSGALGGVVAMRTLDPDDLIGDGKNWGAMTKGSYDSANASWRIDQAFAVRANQTSALFQGGYVTGKQRRNNAYGGGFGLDRLLENPADFDQSNLLFKIYQNIDNTHRFGFTAERFDFDKDIATYTASTATYEPGTAKNEQKRRRERLSLSYDYMGDGNGLLDEAHAVVYWQRQRLTEQASGQRITVPTGYYMRNNLLRDTSFGMNVNGIKRLEWNEVSHTIRFSTDWAGSKFQQYAAGEDNCPTPPYTGKYRGCAFLHTNQSDAPDTKGTSFGFAVEDEIGLFNDRLRLTPGARYDYYKFNPQHTASYEKNVGFDTYPDSTHDSRISPKFRAEWDANENLTFYAQWAQGFRAPTATELYLTYINPNMYYVAGNPDLKPETSNGYDIGANFGNQQLGGSLSVFTNRYKNFIDRESLGANSEFPMFRERYYNRERVRISGVELKGHWFLDNGWHTNAGLTYAEGKDLETDEYLNSVPSLKGVVGVGYANETWGSDFLMTAVAKRDKVENDDDFYKTPGYAVFDLTGWWKPFGEKGPNVRAGVYNIFNKRYWNAVDLPDSSTLKKDYYSEPGRSFKVSFVQKF